ncbi:MAG: NAD(P)H-hydrate epimerase [Candidatus Omnitrophota bacterium]
MLFVSSAKMREIDTLATKKFGMPSLILMENAGRSIADESKKMLKSSSASIYIFCGYGNNGGDGFVAARHLSNRGHKVEIILIGKKKKMSQDTNINFQILRNMRIRIKKIISEKDFNSIFKFIRRPQLIIDAIFGIGIKGELNYFYCRLFEKINSLHVPVLSVDIPSGLDADKGIALPLAIKAKKTVTMGLIKKGFLTNFAKKYLGKIIIADISLPRQLK